ncbi:MAG: LemA family protein, partial [Sphingomicrobium sp.]
MNALHRYGLLAPIAAVSLTGCGVNSVPTAEEQVNAAWGNLQSEYQRRADLVPNLVSTVKGYAQQEKSVLVEVTEARAKATSIQLSGDDLSDPAKV